MFKYHFTIFLGICVGVLAGIILGLFHDLPQIRSLESFRPDSITRIYSSDNVLLAELFIQKRDPVPLSVMPEYLQQALLATEDRNFYQHTGVDIKGILRALVKDILARDFVEGASTLTQQLAKTMFLTSKKTILRKIKEAILSIQLERRYTKDELLALYLNQVYFGSGAYGVESAAKIFFGKSVQELSLSECALIAGLPKAPSVYSPLVNEKLALKRRNTVLKQMLNTRIIQQNEYKQAVKEPIDTLKGERWKETKAPYFIDYIKRYLEQEIGASSLYKKGLNIFTTLSFELQQAADEAAEKGLKTLALRMKKRNIDASDLQCSLIAIDVATGKILAMVGGKNFEKSPYNRAISALRQPGSAFKPIVFAVAIENGYSQNTKLLDAPVSYKDNNSTWEPENFSNDYKGEITLRRALVLSKNIPAVRLIEKLGKFSVIHFAQNLGISATLRPNLSLALGTSEITLIELTSAYSVFPNQGVHSKPFGITKITDHKNNIIWQSYPEKKVVMSRAGAAIMTNMLQGVINEGTGKKAKVIKQPIGGKTGTTNNYKDALFIGFSPSIATGVWVGKDHNKTLGSKETGARAALPIWIEFMKKIFKENHHKYFDIPDDVIKLKMDPVSGKIVTNSLNAVDAFFRKDKADQAQNSR